MTQKDEIRDFSPIESRPHTIEKPQPISGIPTPLLEWLAKIIQRILPKSKPEGRD